MARELKLTDDPKWKRLLKGILIKNNEKAAQKYITKLQSPYADHLITPNNFRSGLTDLNGEFEIAPTIEDKLFGLDRQELNRHMLIAGSSGGGKSFLIKKIIKQAKRKNLYVIHYDPKGDLEHTVREGMISFHYSKIRSNPLCPSSPRVTIEGHRNILGSICADLFEVKERGRAIIRISLDELYKQFGVYDRWETWDWNTMVMPTMRDWLTLLKSPIFQKEKTKGQGGRESIGGIIEKLEGLLTELGSVLECQKGFDCAKLFAKKQVINFVVTGLTTFSRNFLILSNLLHNALYFQTHGPRNQLNLLIIWDEAKGTFGKQNEDSFILKEFTSMVREWGIGLICSDQIPSEISQFFFSNIATLIIFRHSSGEDVHKLQLSSGASNAQILENYSLQPGEAIVRTTKCKDLIRIKIPYVEYEKFITQEEIDRLMEPVLRELYKDVIKVKKSEIVLNANPVKPEPAKPTTVLSAEETAFLQYLVDHYDEPSSTVYKACGLSNSAGFRMKKRLITKNFISQIDTNFGKGGKKAQLLIPNPHVFEKFNIKLGNGRGKPFHKKGQENIVEAAEALGFEATIEENNNGTPEAPDVGLKKIGGLLNLGLRIAVELGVTSKPEMEAKHIEKNFRLGYDRVILSFVSNEVLAKTTVCAQAQYSELTLSKVSFCLLHNISTILKEVSDV